MNVFFVSTRYKNIFYVFFIKGTLGGKMDIGLCIINNMDIRFINQGMFKMIEYDNKDNETLRYSDVFYHTYIDYLWKKIKNNYGNKNVNYRIITNDKKIINVYGHLFGDIRRNTIIMQVYKVISKSLITKADIVYEDENKYYIQLNPREISNSIDLNDYIFVYQPIYDFENNIIAVESLIRLNHPINKVVTPDKFLDVLFNLYDTKNLNKFFFNSCFNGFANLNKSNTNISLSINCSPRQLKQVNLINDIMDIAVIHNVNPQSVWIEINEKVYYDEIIKDNIKKLREKGFVIVLDDFGVKNANLLTLQDVHFELVKIDRSFVKNIVKETISFDIIKMIITLCHKNDMKVVAEGIETKEQADILYSLSCDYVQGYYYSKPVELFDLQGMIVKGEH